MNIRASMYWGIRKQFGDLVWFISVVSFSNEISKMGKLL